MTTYPVAGASLDRAGARELDRGDPLAPFRDRFDVPADLYMDGNSLGPVSDAAEAALERVLEQWRESGIAAWTEADPDWFHAGERLGAKTAPLVGADPESVVVANSTTTNVHSLVGTFLDAADGGTVLVNELDFPTDLYAIKAQQRVRGHDPDEHLIKAPSRDGRTIDADDVVAAIERHDPDLVFQPSVLYRSGQLLDLERIAAAAHERDAYVGFDLAHSVGVVDHDLRSVGADFAVWCNYKYVNGGPGAIAGLYLAPEHHGVVPALPGWWGHEKATQFEMRHDFTPAASAGAFQIGTVPVLSAAPVEGALELIDEAGIERIREKSVALTEFLIALADDRLADHGVSVGTPRDPDRRGGHVALEHEEGYRLSEALRDRGVVVDFRPPDVVRVCPAPLYTGFEDVHEVVETTRSVLESDAYREYDPREAASGVT